VNVDPAAVAILVGSIALLVGAAALISRSGRRLGPGPGAPVAPGSFGSPGADADPDPIAAYLDRMSGELTLPAADVAEVRAELADHLWDSVASLEAEGLDREAATREALGRLGPPAELGRQIRAAHQSTRRLLAGAGGGVFAAGGGFVLGYIGGGVVVTVLALGLYALVSGLAALGFHFPDLLQDSSGMGSNAILIGLTWAIAAWAATRYAARTSASVSHRTPRAVAALWALAGGLLFGWWSVFGLHGYQSWSVVAVELLIPVSAVAGAFVRTERGLFHAPRKVIAVGLIAFIILPLGLFAMAGTVTVSGSSAPQATSFQISDLHLDTVAPMAPAKWLGGDWAFRTSLDGSVKNSDGFEMVASLYSTDTQAEPTLALGAALANWKDVRFEAWHARSMEAPGPGGIDTGYSSPFTTKPAILESNSLQALFDFEHMRDAGSWWVVLTGVGPDGHRYRLDEFGFGNDTDFDGSVWDWLTAPQ
jgi:hypothetical protein